MTGELSPEQQEMAEAMTKEGEKKRDPYKEGIEWLSEQFDIEVLYRVKGYQGLFLPTSVPRKKGKNTGIIRMERFMNEKESYVVHKDTIEGVGGSFIMTLVADENDPERSVPGKPMPIAEAFDNLQKHTDHNMILGNWEITQKDVYKMMTAICPDHDPDAFKVHHARKIVKWYNELVQGAFNAEAQLDEEIAKREAEKQEQDGDSKQ